MAGEEVWNYPEGWGLGNWELGKELGWGLLTHRLHLEPGNLARFGLMPQKLALYSQATVD